MADMKQIELAKLRIAGEVGGNLLPHNRHKFDYALAEWRL